MSEHDEPADDDDIDVQAIIEEHDHLVAQATRLREAIDRRIMKLHAAASSQAPNIVLARAWELDTLDRVYRFMLNDDTLNLNPLHEATA